MTQPHLLRPPAEAPVAPLAEREEVRGLRATIELAPIDIAHFDTEGRFLLANDYLCEMLGCERNDLLSKTFQEITFPEDLEAYIRRKTKAKARRYNVRPGRHDGG